MPGLIGRISTLANAMLPSRLVQKDDPAETLEVAYEHQQEDLQDVKQGFVDVIAEKHQIALQAPSLDAQVGRLDVQARHAMSSGREDLARLTVECKQLIVGELGSLDEQVRELESQQSKLISSEHRLRIRLEQFRTKSRVLIGQHSATEARLRIAEAAIGVGDQMAQMQMQMQRARDTISDLTARASLVEELQAADTFERLMEIGPPQDEIARQLGQIGATNAAGDEFSHLKVEVGAQTAAAATPDSHLP